MEFTRFSDQRGFFVETFNSRTFESAGLPAVFVQDNQSHSKRGVLRGLHFQRSKPQGKLVRAVRGTIFDVAADIRVGSPTFGKWVGVELDDTSMKALWIPPGFAHGFCALSEEADVLYKCTSLYDPADESGVVWNDPLIGITWPVSSPVLSDKDRRLAALDGRLDLPAYR